jgi:hypothetical protein
MSKSSLLLLCLLFGFGALQAQDVAEAPAATEDAATDSGESAEPTETPSEPATPAATSDAPVIQAEDTASMESKVGSEVVIEGTVANVGKGANDNITFLNFGDRRTGFVAVVFRAAYDKFPEGFDKYSQQRVRVRGSLEKYRDRQMQIKIFTPDQLEIVASGAP